MRPSSNEVRPPLTAAGALPVTRPSPGLIAAVTLAALAVAAPWPFGSVHPLALRMLTAVSLTAVAFTALLAALQRGLTIPPAGAAMVLGVLGIGAVQLIPLPPFLHSVLAPGSHAVWHPEVSAAAAVLGPGWRPVSVEPAATLCWVAHVAGLLLLGMLSVPALTSSRTAARVAWTVVMGGLMVAVYGVVARTLFGALLFGRIPVPTVSPFGPFVSKNHFAGYIEMAALLAVGLTAGLMEAESKERSGLAWTSSRRSVAVVLAGASALAMILALLVSLSRGGVISLGLGLVAFFTLHRFVRAAPGKSMNRRGWIVAGTATAALLILVTAVLPAASRERMATLVGITSEQSGSFRLEVWRSALRLFASSPWVGQGMGSFAEAFPRFKTGHGEIRVEHAEDDYVELLVEGGVLAFALGLTVLVKGGRHVVRVSRSRDRLIRGIRCGAAAGVFALLVHSAVDFNLHIPSNAVLFLLLAVLASASSRVAQRHLGRGGSLALAVVAIGLLVAVTRLPLAEIPAGVRDAEIAAAVRDPQARSMRLTRAADGLTRWLRRHPLDAVSWLRLAWVRQAQGLSEQEALAQYALSLDPRWPALRREFERLSTSGAGR